MKERKFHTKAPPMELLFLAQEQKFHRWSFCLILGMKTWVWKFQFLLLSVIC